MTSNDRPAILQVGAYPAWDQEPLDAAYRVHRLFEAEDRAEFLKKVGPEVRAIATRGDLGADRALIEACPKAGLVAIYGVGFDGVDLAACRERGVIVTNTPDVLTDDVADLAIGMLLAFCRRIPQGEAFVRDGRWGKGEGFPIARRVSGMRAGILGLGRIGQSLARRLSAFDMDISYCGRHPRSDVNYTYYPSVTELASAVEVLFVTLSASPETRGIVGREALDALGPNGIVVNVSRGTNIDEAELISALADGRIAGAALDVFLDEPRIDPRFLTLPNVLLQPHVGSATVATRQAMGQLVRDNLSAFFLGRPPVTPVT